MSTVTYLNAVIYLHPEISIADINKLAIVGGLCLTQDPQGNYLLEPHPFARLPSGARYVNSTATDVRATIARAKARLQTPP